MSIAWPRRNGFLDGAGGAFASGPHSYEGCHRLGRARADTGTVLDDDGGGTIPGERFAQAWAIGGDDAEASGSVVAGVGTGNSLVFAKSRTRIVSVVAVVIVVVAFLLPALLILVLISLRWATDVW